MKSRMASLFIVTLAVFALVATSGCCRKPPEEVDKAKAAVAQAKENCAETYAKEDYMKAYDALSMAEKYATDRKCKDARNAANEAISLAAEAEVRANEKKAALDADAKKKMTQIDEMMKKGEAEYQALMAKKAAVEKKRAEALQKAQEKDFAKYNLSLDLPTPTVDPSIEADAKAFGAEYDAIKAKYAQGTCNLIDVNADLDKLSAKAPAMMSKMADNSKALDDINLRIEQLLAARLAELEEAMKPKFTIEDYTVARGNTLWGIASSDVAFKDPFQWPLIWWENQWTAEKAQALSKEERFHLIKDPDLIYPGQVLKIRKGDTTQEKIDEAVKYAKNRYGKTDWREIPDFLTDGK